MNRALVVAICLLALWAPRAEAWNPLKAVASTIAAAGRAIGGVLGAPAGGFIEAATTPVIHSAEDSGHRLIADVDHALAANLDRAGVVAKDTVAQVDRSLAARILQIQTTADHTIDHATDRIDLAIGRLESDAQQVLDRADQAGHALIKQLDGAVAKDLDRVDQILATHINDLQLAVSSSIQQADDAARQRLEQADEIAGRRIGNLDVIATNQSLSLEAAPELARDAIVLSVFTLDDAVLTHARYWAAVPSANGLPPSLTAASSAKALPPMLRARIAPLRVAWEKRYAPLLGPAAREIVSYQETTRFEAFEQRDAAFEAAYVDFLVAARVAEPPGRLREIATTAATRASSLGLYRDTPDGRVSEASRILAPGGPRRTSAERCARHHRAELPGPQVAIAIGNDDRTKIPAQEKQRYTYMRHFAAYHLRTFCGIGECMVGGESGVEVYRPSRVAAAQCHLRIG